MSFADPNSYDLLIDLLVDWLIEDLVTAETKAVERKSTVKNFENGDLESTF